jgi:outer membrane lipoprotein-sorting protein
MALPVDAKTKIFLILSAAKRQSKDAPADLQRPAAAPSIAAESSLQNVRERLVLSDRRMLMTDDDALLWSRRRLLASAAGLVALTALGLPARAAAPRAAQLSPQDQDELKRVQDYLNGIKTLQSRFQQFAQDGGVASGTIYLQRPGKMRIVYDDPVPVLIVCTADTVYYYDKKLEQLSQIAIKDTPAWFLLRPEIKLTGDVTVTNLQRTPGALRIAMTETKQADIGNLTLVLSDRPLELKQWTVVDAQQKPITVTLEDPHYGVQLSPLLFVWNDQRTAPRPR